MSPEAVGAAVDGAIPALAGLWALLVGARVVGKKPGVDPKYDAWHDRLGRHGIWVGVLLLLVAGALALARGQNAGKIVWQRQRTADGVCSAEFPGPPQTGVMTEAGITERRLVGGGCLLAYADLPARVLTDSEESSLDTLTESLATSLEAQGPVRLLSAASLPGGGRDLEFAVGQAVVYARLFLRERRIYRALASAREGSAQASVARRFVGSVRLEPRAGSGNSDEVQERPHGEGPPR